MKLSHKKGKGLKVVSIDGNRRNKLNSSLLRASEKKRRNELANKGNSPSALARNASPSSTKVIVKLNRSGDLRGTNPASHVDSAKAKLIRAMRTVYNKKMPVPQCNGCAFSSNCPQFKAGYECAFLPFLNSHKVETVDDMMDYMKDLVASGMRRFQQATVMETLSGSPPSIELSEQSALLFGQFKQLYDLHQQGNTEMTIETDDTSIVAKLFGNIDHLLEQTEGALDAPIRSHALLEDAEEVVRDKGMAAEVADDYVKIGLEEEAKKSKKAKAVTAVLV